jgi:hypothetical protein
MKTFTYKGFTFTHQCESDPCFTWTIAILHPNSVYHGKSIEVVGDGLAQAKWLASRKLNKLIKND